MLLSMTGFGEARGSGPGFHAAVEVRAVNNRHLKVTVRGTDPYPLLEADIEKAVRKTVRRGSVLVHVRVERAATATDRRLNTAALAGYLAQIRAACDEAGTPELAAAVAAGVLDLPGVAPEPGLAGGPPDDEWPVVAAALDAALVKLNAARATDGRATAAELLALKEHLAAELGRVKEHLPRVTAEYRTRILDRVRQAVGDAGVVVQPEHLIREVALFADRSDVSEEVARFAAHLVQFDELVRHGGGADGAGRRLEFVLQEMGREANTLGSKAGDVVLSRHVVEVKGTLEKIREMVQNVE